jgi:hypothetical protein
MARGGVGRSYGDLTCRATGISVVMDAIFDVTDNALDVVTAATSTLRIVHDRYHSLFIFKMAKLRSLCPADSFSMLKRSEEYEAAIGLHSSTNIVCAELMRLYD